MAIFIVTIGFTLYTIAQDDIPPPPLPPNAFYGDVTINGQPLPAGSTIKAYIDNTLRGSVTIKKICSL